MRVEKTIRLYLYLEQHHGGISSREYSTLIALGRRLRRLLPDVDINRSVDYWVKAYGFDGTKGLNR